MLQLNVGPWLELGPYQRLSVFICHATGGRCEDWDPYKGANAVILHRGMDDNLYDGPPTVRVYRRVGLCVDEPIDERALIANIKRIDEPLSVALAKLQHDKIGGGAVWLRGDATPLAADGRTPLRLVAQITTTLVNFDITEGGMGYLFFDDAGDVSRFLWQGG